MASITVTNNMRGAHNVAVCNVLRLMAHGHARKRVTLRKLGLTISNGKPTVKSGLSSTAQGKAQQWAAFVDYAVKRGFFTLK